MCVHAVGSILAAVAICALISANSPQRSRVSVGPFQPRPREWEGGEELAEKGPAANCSNYMSVQCVERILEAGARIHRLFRGNLAAPGIYWSRRRKEGWEGVLGGRGGAGGTASAAKRKQLIAETSLPERGRCSCLCGKVNESQTPMDLQEPRALR